MLCKLSYYLALRCTLILFRHIFPFLQKAKSQYYFTEIFKPQIYLNNIKNFSSCRRSTKLCLRYKTELINVAGEQERPKRPLGVAHFTDSSSDFCKLKSISAVNFVPTVTCRGVCVTNLTGSGSDALFIGT
jgi:hypothetical protein